MSVEIGWGKIWPNSTDFTAFLKGDLDREFVRLMQILDRRGQAHQHISQTYKLLSENTFIITFEIPGKLPLELAFLPRSSLIMY